jgi:hypothetical protein
MVCSAVEKRKFSANAALGRPKGAQWRHVDWSACLKTNEIFECAKYQRCHRMCCRLTAHWLVAVPQAPAQAPECSIGCTAEVAAPRFEYTRSRSPSATLTSLSLDVSKTRILRLLTTPDSPAPFAATVTLMPPAMHGTVGSTRPLSTATSVSSAYDEIMGGAGTARGARCSSDNATVDMPASPLADWAHSIFGWEDMGAVGGLRLVLAPAPPSSADDAPPPKVAMVDDVRIILSESSRSVDPRQRLPLGVQACAA